MKRPHWLKALWMYLEDLEDVQEWPATYQEFCKDFTLWYLLVCKLHDADKLPHPKYEALFDTKSTP